MYDIFKICFSDDEGGGAAGQGLTGDTGARDTSSTSDGSGDSVGTSVVTPPADSGASTADWKSGLSEDLRENPSLSTINTVDDLAKSYVHAQKSLGNNIGVPGKDATDEEWNAFYAAAGRPESPDKYSLTEVDGAEKLGLQSDQISGLRDEAHRLGLSQRQVDGLYQFWQKQGLATIEAMDVQDKAATEKGFEQLRQEWGAAHDEKLSQAQAAAKEFGGEEFIELLDSTGYGNHPTVIKTFAKIGRAMADDQLFGKGADMRTGHRLTPSEAQQRIGQKQLDSTFMDAYTNRENPGHAAAVAEMQELFAAASASGDANPIVPAAANSL